MMPTSSVTQIRKLGFHPTSQPMRGETPPYGHRSNRETNE